MRVISNQGAWLPMGEASSPSARNTIFELCQALDLYTDYTLRSSLSIMAKLSTSSEYVPEIRSH